MSEPISLVEVQQHLKSHDPSVRRAALVHLRAHGTEGLGLAPLVAAALDDPDPAVQYEATGTFRAVGAGAGEAAPVLLGFLGDASSAPMLRQRAFFCLGIVGPSASAAIPTLLKLASGDEYQHAVETLVAIAAERDPRVAELVGEALFDSSYTVHSTVARALRGGVPWLVELAMNLAEQHASSPEHGMTAMGMTLELGERFPERTTALAHRAIRDCLPGARMAVLCVERGKTPIPIEVARGLLALGRGGDDGAYRTLGRCAGRVPEGEFTEEAQAALVEHVQATPELRTLDVLVVALAAIAGREPSLVPSLIARVKRELRSKSPGWYPVGAILEALGSLADERVAEEVRSVLEAALKRSKGFLRKDESAVLDFQRRVKSGLEALAGFSELARAAAEVELEVDIVDAEHAQLDELQRQRTTTLPVIPEESAGPSLARVRAARKAERQVLEECRAEGRPLLSSEGLTLRSAPTRIAEFVDAEVRSLRRKRKRSSDLGPALAVLYGDALVRTAAWRWMLWSQDGEQALAVVAPRNKYVLLPGKMVTAKLQPGADVTFMLLFNMLKAGQLPAAKRGDLIRLG